YVLSPKPATEQPLEHHRIVAERPRDNPPLERTAAAVYFTRGRASRVRRRGRSTALRYASLLALYELGEVLLQAKLLLLSLGHETKPMSWTSPKGLLGHLLRLRQARPQPPLSRSRSVHWRLVRRAL